MKIKTPIFLESFQLLHNNMNQFLNIYQYNIEKKFHLNSPYSTVYWRYY